jgi:tetratricopeptide (TPR) repeat protein
LDKSIEQALDKIVSGLNSKETVVWCGSGISKNSGIPVVGQFLEYLLTRIEIEDQDKKAILNSNLPFEKFMEIISETTRADRLFDIYDADRPRENYIRPDANHVLLAKLARERKIKVIVTTNFDRLIEKALQAEGCIEGTDYRVTYREKDFHRINWHGDKVELIKIHGCISDRNNMVITLKRVARKELSSERAKVVRNVFSENGETGLLARANRLFPHSASQGSGHRNVLILGYSSSDVFDICPQIESIKDNFKNVYYIEHIGENESPFVESITNKKDKNPFKQFSSSQRIYINTDLLTDYIRGKTTLNDGPAPIKHDVSWQTGINDWFKTGPYLTKYLLSYRLLFEISELNRSMVYAKKGLEIVSQNGDRPNEVTMLTCIGNAFLGLADYPSALANYESALKTAEEIGDRKNQGLNLENISMVYIRMGNIKKALEYSGKAQETIKTSGNPEAGTKDPFGQGVICYRSGKYSKAIGHFQEAVDTAVKTGNKTSEGMGLGNLGAVYWRLGNHAEAKKCLNRALEISLSIGDKSSECKWTGNLGNIHVDTGQYEKGIEYFKKALALAEEIGDRYTRVIWLGNLGDAFNALNDGVNARNYFEQALEINRQLGDRDSEIVNLAGIGHVHYNLKEYNRAIEYYEKALKIAVETGSRHMHGRLLSCIAAAYAELDDGYSGYRQKSVEYYKKSLDILIPLLGKNHPEVKDIIDSIQV